MKQRIATNFNKRLGGGSLNFLSYPGLQRFWTKVKSYVDTKIADSSGNKVTYSESERIVGTWIDGRPIYEVTVTGNAGGYGAGAWNLAAKIEDASIDSCIRIWGTRIDHNSPSYGFTKCTIEIPNSHVALRADVISGGIRIYTMVSSESSGETTTGVGWPLCGGGTMHFTVQYVKKF